MGPHIFFGPMLVLFDFGLKTQVLEFGKVTDLAQKDWEVGLGYMSNVYQASAFRPQKSNIGLDTTGPVEGTLSTFGLGFAGVLGQGVFVLLIKSLM